jgi:AhpD family alkylhydroperoxidase
LAPLGDAFPSRTQVRRRVEVAVATRCDGCITVHTGEALKRGDSRGGDAEALGVAVELNTGPAFGVLRASWMR